MFVRRLATGVSAMEDITKSIMKHLGTESVPSSHKDGPPKSYVKYRCPNSRCTNPVLKFLGNSGFSNPHRSLLFCYERIQPLVEQQRIVSRLFQQA